MQPELKLSEGYQEEEYNGAAAPDRRSGCLCRRLAWPREMEQA